MGGKDEVPAGVSPVKNLIKVLIVGVGLNLSKLKGKV